MHGITVKEYKEKYGLDSIISDYTKNNLVKCGGNKFINKPKKPKVKKYISTSSDYDPSQTYEFNCEECGYGTHTDHKLGLHLKYAHNMTRHDYLIKHKFNGIFPVCKCGCGNQVSKIHTFPYFREYINGHNVTTLGYKFSDESKIKMSESAINKFKMWKELNYTPTMHNSNSRLLSHHENIENYKKYLLEKNITLLSTEISDINKFKCNLCNTEWEQSSLKISCDICSKVRSIEELELKTFLKNHNIEFLYNKRTIIPNSELDIYIPELNMAIEYNGLYYHSEISGEKDRKYHINKTKLCEERNIRLIQIFSDEWKLKNSIIKNKLLHILNKSNATKIHARKCTIKEVSSKEKSEFLKKNHIQGDDTSSIKIGAYYNNTLISIMTFGTVRIALGNKNKNSYEMYRFCMDSHYLSAGIANRLLQYFIKNYSPSQIISYADVRWTDKNNNLYLNLGFKLESVSPPNYWYTKDYRTKIHRFAFRKNVLKFKLEKFDESLTEWNNMINNGYDRVWDCGNYKYILNI